VLRKTFVINLDRRKDRLDAVTKQFADANVVTWTRWPAVDGHNVPVPSSYKAPAGAYGCKLSHTALLAHALEHGHDPVMVFEDDVVVVKGFKTRLDAWLEHVPGDWDAIMVGGQHEFPPVHVNDHVVRVTKAGRTHAYVVRMPYMQRLHDLFDATDTHIDYAWKDHQLEAKVYAPKDSRTGKATWFCGQAESYSDIKNMNKGENWWPTKTVYTRKGQR
jgi:GR25 family glycosyltransferase involved in LPS biosynthesis